MPKLPMTVIRRLVTGNDAQGRSTIVWDGPAPNANNAALASRTHNTNIWVWDGAPLALSGTTDEGDTPYEFPGPRGGGHVRVVETLACPEDYDPASDPDLHEVHEPKSRPSGRSWDRGGKNIYSAGMHKTQSVDYLIVISGEIWLVLDEEEVCLKAGDSCVQRGTLHAWSNRTEEPCLLAAILLDAVPLD